ncbi:hypothetical protein ACHAPT_003972 [Fusarium lateritium]
MDPELLTRFLSSPLGRDLQEAFQAIIIRKIEESLAAPANQDPDVRYYITGLPPPHYGGCWCTRHADEMCNPRTSCPCAPRPVMGVNMRLVSCNCGRSNGVGCARRNCFSLRDIAAPYFRGILSRRAEPRTPWPPAGRLGVTNRRNRIGNYAISEVVYDRFMDAICAVLDDMIDPFNAGNAGWLPHVHGLLGWYGQSGLYCIDELMHMRMWCEMERQASDNPRFQTAF